MSKKRYNSCASIAYLPIWKPIEVVSKGQTSDIEINVDSDASRYSYSARYAWGDKQFLQQMPALIRGNGIPWAIGNHYLINIIERDLNIKGAVNMQTIRSKATDLLDYLRWLEDSGSNPMSFPAKAFQRVTYQYNHFLHQQVATGAIAASTARRFINSISDFYRYLAREPTLIGSNGFDNPPFEEQVAWLPIKNDMGQSKTVKVVSTDLSQSHHVPKKSNFQDTIQDGGALKPLDVKDQIILIKYLLNSPNIEMRLIHLIAIFTGARIQSICTLRFSHLQIPKDFENSYINIHAGRGTSVDTKGGKRQVLQIPCVIIEMLKTYYHSDRARRRREKFQLDYGNDNYVFLSQQGIPFYKSLYDEQLGRQPHQTRTPRDAASVREFVKNLRRSIQKDHPNFYYRFHDLRATFGMNLVNRCLHKIETGQMTYLDALEIVKERLKHSSRETTERYLKYQVNKNRTSSLQDDYESFLLTLIKEAQ